MSSVSVPVTNDDVAEGTEEFDLMLTVPPSLAPAITAGGRNTAVGVITDSTSKCMTVHTISSSYIHMCVPGFLKSLLCGCMCVCLPPGLLKTIHVK